MPQRPRRLDTANKKTKKFGTRASESRRGTAASRGYGSKWQKARKAYLLKHPLCANHEAKGEVVAADVVDHKIPHCGDMKLFWDSSNWQSLCTPCHNSKTASEDGGFGNKKTQKRVGGVNP